MCASIARLVLTFEFQAIDFKLLIFPFYPFVSRVFSVDWIVLSTF